MEHSKGSSSTVRTHFDHHHHHAPLGSGDDQDQHLLTSAVAPVMTSASGSSLEHQHTQQSHGGHGQRGKHQQQQQQKKQSSHGDEPVEHRLESGDHTTGVIHSRLLKPVFPQANNRGEQVLSWFRTRLIHRHGLFWMYDEEGDKFLLSAVLHNGTFYISQNATFPNNFNKSSPTADESDSGGHCIAVMRPGFVEGSFQLFSAYCENCDDRLGTYSCEPISQGQHQAEEQLSQGNGGTTLSGRISKILSWVKVGGGSRGKGEAVGEFDELDIQPRELLAEIEQWQEDLMNGTEVFRRMRVNIPRVFADSSRTVWCLRNPPGTGSGFSIKLAPEYLKKSHRSKTRTKRKVTSHYQQTYSPAFSYSKESADSIRQIDTLDLSSSLPERSNFPPVHRGPPSLSKIDRSKQEASSFEIPSLSNATGDNSKRNGRVGSPILGSKVSSSSNEQPHRGPPPLQRGFRRANGGADTNLDYGNGGLRSVTDLGDTGHSSQNSKIRSKTDLQDATDTASKAPFADRVPSVEYIGSPSRHVSDLEKLPTESFGGSDKASLTDTASSARDSFDEMEDPQDDVVAVQSRVPRWSRRIRSFTLTFAGAGTRVKESSSKNFLFCIDSTDGVMKPVWASKAASLGPSARRSSAGSAESSLSNESERQQNMVACLQFGKVEPGVFTCDFRFPFCPLQAFGSALSSFYWLPASPKEREADSDAPSELESGSFSDTEDSDY